MRRVDWSDTALEQFDVAIAYLTERNPSAADLLADRLEETVAALSRRPLGRPGYHDGTYEKAVLRTNYVVVYSLIGGTDNALRVHRVFHTAQNWRNWSPLPG